MKKLVQQSVCIAFVLYCSTMLAGCMSALPADSSPPEHSSFAPILTLTPEPVNTETRQAAEGFQPTDSVQADMLPESVPSTPDTSVPMATPVPPTATQPAPPTATQPAPPTATPVLPTATQPAPPTATPVLPTATQPAPPTASPVQATPTPEVVVVAPTLPPLSNEQRWRNQQTERNVFDSARTFSTSGSELWWYDPIQQQHVILGSFTGQFTAQARFVLSGQGRPALEVPYQINQSYGLTSISPALIERMQAAGYTDWIETYVFESPSVEQR